MFKLSVFTLSVCVLLNFSNGRDVQGLDHNPCVEEGVSPYMIVIDGGSTGSRLHVFQFLPDQESEDSPCICTRQGSSRANVPMSAFGPEDDEQLDPAFVAEHMLPLFEFAAQVIPPSYHNNTIAKYQATAGMRLLTEEQQRKVYDALYDGLVASESFVFRGMQRGDIETLSGDLEGYYGAVAANYLSGIIDANLHVVAKEDRDVSTTHPIGALDMGGSSTQIVYLTEQIDNGSHSCSNPTETTAEQQQPADQQEEGYPQTCSLQDFEGKKQLQGENFFSTSYLAYGVDQFRERLWNTLISDRYMDDYTDSCDTKIIEYPCGFKGHQLQWEDYTFVGTGDADQCAKQVRRLLPHAEMAVDDHHHHAGQRVGGIDHPEVTGEFFAMSLYFFTLDSLRVLSHPKADAHDALNSAWPRPSIDELTNALEGLCSRTWQGDLEDIQDSAHEFTRAEVLPHRCFESVYMVTLLRDGFGFHPESRDITFTFLVDGSEVEWSLGMALSLRSEMKPEESNNTETAKCHEVNSENNSTTREQTSTVANVPPESMISLATVVSSSG